MSDVRIITPYGHAWIMADHVAISATHGELFDWARRPGYVWPCSVLERLDQIRVEFDSGGLLDIATSGETNEIMADELNAWSRDVLRDILPRDHPCWFVNVGQFLDE